MAEIKKCPICRSDVVDGKCSQKRRQNCPYVEIVEENKEKAAE
jgi:hypothetical protein